LIWSDTQGFEGHVLAGATIALRSQPPLVLEFWPHGMKRSQCYPLLKTFLIENGYNVFYELRDKPSPVALTAQSLDCLYAEQGEEGFTEILVLRD
jgi:hypothetical protein